jgi:CPA2 family monovalent cation:H+ antiporter-2
LHYGDVTSHDILKRAGVGKAGVVVVLLNDPRATLHAVRVARAVGPKATIIVRARYVGETQALLAAGADEVVAQELEASFTIIERVTREAKLPKPGRTAAHAPRTADALPAVPGGAAALPAGVDVESAVVPENAWIAGRSLTEADMRRRTGATLVAFTRGSDTSVHPSPDEVLRAGDVLTLVGDERQLADARALIASGPAADS